MEERIWTRHDDREMEFSPRKTSLGRLWTGFNAYLYDTSGGFSEVLFTNNSVSMHVGRPVLASTRCDGATLRRLQVSGDIKIVPAGFSRVWETDGPTSKLVANISPTLVCAAAEGMGLKPDRVSILPQLHLQDKQIEHILWALKAELEAEEPLGHLYADSLGLALAAHLLRRYAPAVSPRVLGGFSKQRLRRVIDYIHDHLASDLTLAELAQIADLSPTHFKSLFKQSVGQSVHQYVIRRRVEYAIDLLSGGKARACDVAVQVGFANQSHMARCMRRIAGVAPSNLKR